ncbi:hypothetical protein BKA81DRAFT_319160, partial [Phyllosticta paracitricarpa]
MESPRGTVHATTTDAHSRIPQCCCGNSDCPYLSHNGHLLEGLERDVQTAAQLGQALLQRHEAYIADSEAERRRMAAKIEELEREKADLESKNAQSIQENRDLLDQLEAMNNAVADSDKRIADLSKHLSSTQDELTRLTNQASRTETLERQLASLEKEQVDLQSRLSSTAGESKSAVQRWRKAERIINELQEQIERIERESREERERHVEIVGRMERRRAVEKELETAAGRLKGAAAAKVAQSKTDTNVVSHFVKDILQDNANLQIGIVELRDMLTNANEEVERLREQLMLHQPLDEPCESEAGVPNLQNELGFDPEVTSPKSPEKSPSYLPNEYHVHHHLHFKPDASKDAPKAKGNHEPPLDTQPPEINRDIYSTLRRQSSHESLLSVSGMDIHTLQSRPSQILFAPSSPSKLARGSLSSMTARPSLSYKHDTDALSSYQSLLVGKRIGGWMFGKWGAAPTPTPS